MVAQLAMMPPPDAKDRDRNADLARDVVRRFERLCGARYVWESHWEDIARYCLPAHQQSFNGQGRSWYGGDRRTDYILDATPIRALKNFAAVLDSLLTPRTKRWHILQASDPALNESREVRLWFEAVNKILFEARYSPRSNFAAQNSQVYQSLGAFGTGALYVDELANEPGLRYRCIHLGELYVDVDEQGVVDTVYRHFMLTARQAWQRWGKRAPRRVLDCMEKHEQWDREFRFIHCVMPRAEAEYDGRLRVVGGKGMPWASYYVSVEEPQVISESGYWSMPYLVARYDQAPREIYGRSPGMDTLPAMKTLTEMVRTFLQQGHKAVNPALLLHGSDDLLTRAFSVRAGALNAGGVTADGRALVHTLPVGQIALGRDLIEDQRLQILQPFLNTIFDILEKHPEMTATEVLDRAEQRGIFLEPTVGRLQPEYLGPLIERELEVLARQGLLPPQPQILLERRGEYRIEYASRLTREQRAEEAVGAQRTVEWAMAVSAQTGNPGVLDNIDLDRVVRLVSAANRMPEDCLTAEEDIQAARESRAEAAQNQELIQAAPGTAAMLKATAVAQREGAGFGRAPKA